jgi:hypothetical protein
MAAAAGKSRRLTADCIILDDQASPVPGYLFISDRLDEHWPMLDEFEDGYGPRVENAGHRTGQPFTANLFQDVGILTARAKRAINK